MTHLQTVILELSTDEGVTGLGEVRGTGVSLDVQKQLEQALRGQDPRQISSIIPMLEGRFGHGPLVAGIDFALHDIKARALDVPVFEIFGGKHRELVPLVWTLPYLDIEDQVIPAQEMIREGFTHAIKMKVGVPGDSDHIRAVAKVIGDVPIRPATCHCYLSLTACAASLPAMCFTPQPSSLSLIGAIGPILTRTKPERRVNICWSGWRRE